MEQHITVVQHRSDWEESYNKEAGLIKAVLKDNCVGIYHIGSTSVKGLKAKPIIDILPVVNELSEVDAVSEEFEKLGYEYMGEYGIEGRRFLRKGGVNRTHHIHIFQKEDAHNIKRHIAVRDYLRTHKDTACEYGELKEELAAKYPYDIEQYCDGKDAFVKRLEKMALEWSALQPKTDTAAE